MGYSIIAYQMPWKDLFSVQWRWVSILFLASSIGIGCILGLIISKHFTDRVKRIHEAVKSYSFGEKIEIANMGHDELSDISKSLGGLTELVSVHLDRIQGLNVTLEERINYQLEEINALKVNIESKNQNQIAFLGHMTQDIQISIELLNKLIMKAANATSPIEQMRKIINHLSQLISRLLLMIRQNSPLTLPLTLTKLSVPQLITELSPLFDILSEENNNVISVNIDKNIDDLLTDETQFRQSILQLIVNASKYTNNGEIFISVLKETNQAVVIEIKDTGIGMDQTKINEVFEAMDKDELNIVTAFSTLGLGLVLIHRFSQSIEGQLHSNQHRRRRNRSDVSSSNHNQSRVFSIPEGASVCDLLFRKN